MARRVSKRYRKAFSIALSTLRPDMGWVEALLGEEFPHQEGHCGKHAAPPRGLTPDVIPPGNYCYYPEWLPGVEGHRPCPYFRHTSHGSVRCDYLPFETTSSDADSARTVRYFKRLPRRESQHFRPYDYLLDDAIKRCDVHPEFPNGAAGLRNWLDRYQSALTGHVVEQWFGGWNFSPEERQHNTDDMQLLTIASFRLSIWECLCTQVELIHPEDVQRLQRLDALCRAHSEPSPRLMHAGFAHDAQKHARPEQQFWYLYRTNFRRLSPGLLR